MLIEIDGIDGAGKTTQCELLGQTLNRLGVDYLLVREPGGTPTGDRIKQLIMEEEAIMAGGSQTFLFLATKYELYNRVILPALASGKWVISDRGSLSFLSYHNILSGFSDKFLTIMLNEITKHDYPVLKILLDVAPNVAWERLLKKQTLSIFDKKGEAFFERQRAMFRFLASQDSVNIKVLDASSDENMLHKQIISLLSQALGSLASTEGQCFA